uniref:Phosphatidylinositol transfer protein cytoplasmic 1 n=1 Tax=Anolis carolinensis TaxID=28377 RepID=A0A803TLF5_ANOCA
MKNLRKALNEMFSSILLHFLKLLFASAQCNPAIRKYCQEHTLLLLEAVFWTAKSCLFITIYRIYVCQPIRALKCLFKILQIFDNNEAKDLDREVCFIDIACDEIPERYYKESEDPKYFKSEKTGRGLLKEGWRDTQEPIMCSYKLVSVKFEVWGLQTRVEQFVHKVVRDILLIGHRQAFAWVDEWYDMTMEDVREYEKSMHEKTNIKVCNQPSSPVDEIDSHAKGST